MPYETLLTALDEGVMTVTLNRPDKLNAFDTVMSRELIDFFRKVNAMDDVRAIVVTGVDRNVATEEWFRAMKNPKAWHAGEPKEG